MTVRYRRSLRLKHYDYSRAGLYFITICTQGKEHLFGEIVDDEMVLGLAGEMVYSLWYEITRDFPNVVLHEFVIMPNHIHGIIEIVDNDKNLNTVGADSISALKLDYKYAHDLDDDVKCHWMEMELRQRAELTQKGVEMTSKRAEMDSAPTLGKMMQSFKRHTTLQYIKMVKTKPYHPSTNAYGNVIIMSM